MVIFHSYVKLPEVSRIFHVLTFSDLFVPGAAVSMFDPYVDQLNSSRCG